ncbi:MAG: low-specificity L-threonine aldolase [Bacillota bacterium]
MTIRIVDLRSDTVTLPSLEMREAMAHSKVGDDIYGEDPTVNLLQEEAAALVGKEAALFVTSGTMGNQLAILAHTSRGDEVIADSQSHIHYYEVGAPAMWAGVSIKPVDGLLEKEGIEALLRSLRPEDLHFPTTRLVCLENTFNRGGGTVMTPETMRRIYNAARERSLSVHLDGARIFNAAVALKRDVRNFTDNCDSVMFCLSKGLGAPVGSILAGSRDFISKSRKYRKALGGGMRQAGILAAAGLVALKNISRLNEDHRHARILARGMSELPGIEVDPEQVQTNIVVLKVNGSLPAAGLVQMLREKGILCATFGPDLVRMVTHLNISPDDIEYTLITARQIVER